MNRNIKKIILSCLLLFLLIGLAGCKSTPRNTSLANEYFVIGNDYFEMKNYEKAEEFFLKAIIIDPGFKKLNYNLARVYLENGRYNQGREILLELLELDKENQKILETIGYSFYLEKKYELASKYYIEVLTANKKDTTARFNFAVILKKQQKNDEALAILLEMESEKITTINNLYYNIAEIYEALKEKEKAIEYYEKTLSSPLTSKEKLDLLNKLISYYEKEKLYSKVIEKMNELTTLLPSEEQGKHLFEQGKLILIYTEDYSKGLDTIKEALNKGFNNKPEMDKLLRTIKDPDIKESLAKILKESKKETPEQK